MVRNERLYHDEEDFMDALSLWLKWGLQVAISGTLGKGLQAEAIPGQI